MLRNRAAALVLFLASCPLAYGLGLGDIEQSSALNEPFDARIQIRGATANDFDSLSIRLAGPEQFERAGVLRAAVLLQLKFEITQTSSGADYVQISSQQPIREPFLDFLLELNWANGRMVREYTVLLDPPLYDRNKRVAPMGLQPKSAAAGARSLAQKPPPSPAAPAFASGTYVAGDTIGPIKTGDTLWSLASAYRPDETVSIQQMMLAILRTNPAAFMEGNVNMLSRGAVLRIPDREEIARTPADEAFAEVKRHHQLWEQYRQGAAAAPVAEQPIGADVGSAVAGTRSEPAGPAGRLELAAPGGEGQADVPGRDGGTANDVSLLQEQMDASAQGNKELRAKLDEADEIIDLLQRQVEIKDEELSALQTRLAELGIDLGDLGEKKEPVEADTSAAVEVPEPAEPLAGDVEESKPPQEIDIGAGEDVQPMEATPPVEEGSPSAVVEEAPMVGGVLDGLIPPYIADMVPGGAKTVLGVAILVFLLVVGFVAKGLIGRREAFPAVADGDSTVTAVTEDIEEGDEPITETRDDQQPSWAEPEDDDPTLATIEASAQDLSPEVEEDPLEEVNVYLAYERFDQAEELVKKVIAEHPDEHKYKLRLLEVYYSANNKQAYEATARTVYDAVGEDDPLWESTVAMWAEMSPARALFEAGADSELASDQGPVEASKAFVDITGDAGPAGDATLSMVPGGDVVLEETQIGPDEQEMDGSLDFDLSGLDDVVGAEDGAADPTMPSNDGARDALDFMGVVDDEILDLTTTGGDDGSLDFLSGAGEDDGTFDLTAGDMDSGAESGEVTDLLDVTKTGGPELDRQDLLNVTSPGLSELDDVLDLSEDQPSEPEGLVFDITSDAVDDSGDALDFYVGEIGEKPIEDVGGEETTPGLAAGEPAFELDEDATTTAGPDAGGDGTAADPHVIDFDISDFGVEEVVPEETGDGALAFDPGEAGDLEVSPASAVEQERQAADAGEVLDLDLGETGDLSTALAWATAAAAENRVVKQDQAEEPGDAVEEDFELSLQGSELDDLAAREEPPEEDAEAEIEFDLALQDTTDMDSFAIDDTLELSDKIDETTIDLDDADGQSIEDLTRSMEDSLSGLESDDGADFELEEGDHFDTLVLDDDRAGSEWPGTSEQTVTMPRYGDDEHQSDVDEADTKLNLAKAYIELGDKDGARSILEEVARDGNEEQQGEAQQQLAQL